MKTEIEFLEALREDLQMLDFIDNSADRDLIKQIDEGITSRLERLKQAVKSGGGEQHDK